ncbi:protein phosphatase 1, regulatory subunit 3Da [Chanos chanos]|uniref:Protein phosphatase 1, regulatory subunit 3Da n=1 Tax=Chanos chanos TaxID=29144 RepID=A0A6J2UYV0_CHACN|nr:protein phosphatase 1 regulatory subunit 3D [Chanos chanos]
MMFTMAWSLGFRQQKSQSGMTENDLVFSWLSDVSKEHPVYTRDDFCSKPAAEKPVKIRPPTPKTPTTRQPAVRSLSCEPLPKPIIHRRAQSLPSPPERRRQIRRAGVRFVDSLGVELENVKVFSAGENPSVPQHVLFRLLMNSELAGGKKLEISLPLLKPMFPEKPADHPSFSEHLCHQKVCLEQVLCNEMGITGIVQVLNLAFEKEIKVRYSFTNWKSFSETKAHWVSNKPMENVPNGPSCDTFCFHLPVPPFILTPGAILEFAICYKVLGTEFWDNNGGQNYKLVCHSYKLTVPKECEDSMIHFI